jgi:hypothetical protein
MKSSFVRGVVFVSKSLLWSVILYTVCILTINWDEIHANLISSEPASIARGVKPLSQLPVAVVIPENPTPSINIAGNKNSFFNTIAVLMGVYKTAAVFSK